MTDPWTQLQRYARLRRLLLVATVGGAALLAIISYETGALNGPERQTVDARFAIRGTEPPGKNVVIVAVDQATTRALGGHTPIPRSPYAQVIKQLRAAGARLIAVDVQFGGKTDPRDDNALVHAVARDGPILLGTNDTKAGPLPVPAGVRNASGAVLGSAAVDADPDGVLRRMLYVQIVTKTLAVRAAELLRGRAVSRSDFPDNHAWVDFRGPPGTFPTYTMIDVLKGRVSSQAFAGKAVLVGVTDPTEKDVFTTAVSSLPMSGVEFQANALTTILDGFPLQPLSGAVEILLLLGLAALPALLSLRFAGLYVLLASIVVLVVFLVAAQLAFNSGTIVAIPDPILALALGTAGAVAVDSFVQLRSHQVVFDLLPGPSDFFVSYRRGQSELAANTLREGLARKFGKKHVFMDTDAIDPGEEWPRRIEEAIAACRAMLVVIGPLWLEPDAAAGERRLDNPRDWVRREIEAGLSREDIVVVPVIHDGARHPGADQLPDSIKPLAYCQSIQLTGRDIEQWISELAERIQVGRMRHSQPVAQAAAERSGSPP